MLSLVLCVSSCACHAPHTRSSHLSRHLLPTQTLGLILRVSCATPMLATGMGAAGVAASAIAAGALSRRLKKSLAHRPMRVRSLRTSSRPQVKVRRDGGGVWQLRRGGMEAEGG